MTDKPTPTDAELKAMWQLHAADIGGIFYYARAVLAKWGTPAESWRGDLRQGFAECFRVLASNGTLIFKWAEDQVKVREVLELAPHPPLFGHPTGRKGLTHWMVFMKPLEKSQ